MPEQSGFLPKSSKPLKSNEVLPCCREVLRWKQPPHNETSNTLLTRIRMGGIDDYNAGVKTDGKRVYEFKEAFVSIPLQKLGIVCSRRDACAARGEGTAEHTSRQRHIKLDDNRNDRTVRPRDAAFHDSPIHV